MVYEKIQSLGMIIILFSKMNIGVNHFTFVFLFNRSMDWHVKKLFFKIDNCMCIVVLDRSLHCGLLTKAIVTEIQHTEVGNNTYVYFYIRVYF